MVFLLHKDYCRNPNDNITQPQHFSWVGRKNDDDNNNNEEANHSQTKTQV